MLVKVYVPGQSDLGLIKPGNRFTFFNRLLKLIECKERQIFCLVSSLLR